MNAFKFLTLLLSYYLIGCQSKDQQMNLFKSGTAQINGLDMYYEMHGEGKPLLLIHGGGSTIQSNFEKVIPIFAKSRQVIAIELQGHGRTSDRDGDSSFEQDADDVAALLHHLSIEKADVLGFSNGGTTAIQFALRHPEMLDKLVICSALTKRDGVPAEFWELMKSSSLDNMPPLLQKAYLDVNPGDSIGFQRMHDLDAKRMVHFEDIPDKKLKEIANPTLIISSNKDVILPEHSLELSRLIPKSELMILPGLHGEFLGEVTTLAQESKLYEAAVPMIQAFLERKK